MGNVPGRLLYKLLEFPKSAATTREKSSGREHEINLPELPESCIAAILSFTTPRDVCRLSAVSKVFRSAAYDDSIWNKFIPQKCYRFLRRAVEPVPCSSKRELYFRICDSILIDGGAKRIWLERSTAKIRVWTKANGGDDQRMLSTAGKAELFIYWPCNDQRMLSAAEKE